MNDLAPPRSPPPDRVAVPGDRAYEPPDIAWEEHYDPVGYGATVCQKFDVGSCPGGPFTT